MKFHENKSIDHENICIIQWFNTIEDSLLGSEDKAVFSSKDKRSK